jgi:hypothetical protein
MAARAMASSVFRWMWYQVVRMTSDLWNREYFVWSLTHDIMSDDVISRRGSWLMASWWGSYAHVTPLSFRHVGITGCRTLKCTSLEKPFVTLRPYQISWKSVQPFSSYMHTDDDVIILAYDHWQWRHDGGSFTHLWLRASVRLVLPIVGNSKVHLRTSF